MLHKLGYVKRCFSSNVVIVAGKRTPIGSFMGQCSNFPASQLGIVATRGALDEAQMDPKDVEEVYFGQVLQHGSGQAPATQVALGSQMREDIPCTTINKVCASGMKSVMMAAQAI